MTALLLALLSAPAGQAMPMPEAKVACPARPAALPAELAGWSAAAPVTAAANAAGVGAAMLTIGKGAVATLVPTAAVALPVASTRAPKVDSRAGLFAFSVAGTGRYRVALGAGVWIDVVANGAALPSVAHGHGPACSPVRKTVDFDLKPGRYLLQVTGSDAAVLPLLIARLPG